MRKYIYIFLLLLLLLITQCPQVGVLDGLIYVLRSILRRRRERRRRKKRGRGGGGKRVERVRYEERYCLTYENGDKK